MEESSYPARPVLGRLLALDLRPTRPLTLIGPAVAALCGALASGGLDGRAQSWVVLVLSILLCDALIGAWRALWLHADWRVALPRNLTSARIWLMLPDDAPVAFLPRISRALTRRIAFARNVIWPLIDSEIIGMLMAGILAVCIAATLSPAALALTVVALILALVEGEASDKYASSLRALIELALPWLIAQSAFGYFSWFALFFVLLFTLIYRALLGLAEGRQERWLIWNNVAQLVIVLVLFASNTPIGAGIVALGLLAQILWQTRFRTERAARAYAQQIQSYVLAAMLVVSISLWF
ncbi:MAG: hypothetical protein L0Y55_08835 [Anaerolineales bacterium]|nr:hypothetical protein [Anaerolineales bacterium]